MAEQSSTRSCSNSESPRRWPRITRAGGGSMAAARARAAAAAAIASSWDARSACPPRLPEAWPGASACRFRVGRRGELQEPQPQPGQGRIEVVVVPLDPSRGIRKRHACRSRWDHETVVPSPRWTHSRGGTRDQHHGDFIHDRGPVRSLEGIPEPGDLFQREWLQRDPDALSLLVQIVLRGGHPGSRPR